MDNSFTGCPVGPARAVEINPWMVYTLFSEVLIECQLASFLIDISNHNPGPIVTG
jgi:hypothetical protein